MKTSFVVFVVVLAFVVLDFSEAFPAALSQNAPNTFGGGQNAPNTFGKGKGKGKGGNPFGKGKGGNPAKGGNNNNPPPSDFCGQSGLPPMNGLQAKGGQVVCSNTELGAIPSVNKMVSSVITDPQNGAQIKQNTPFTVNVKINNMETGFFSDPDKEYYLKSQTLNAAGLIQGHSHITIDQLFGNNPPNPQVPAFFKGLNDAAKNGILSVTVDKGLPSKGTYRICTMNSANTHQAVVMPVAQRGAQDDCIRVNVV